jgi:protein-L-isoaspartate(D-aspartate) O-methyltransferase
MSRGKNRYLKSLADAGIRKATVKAFEAVERLKYFDPIFSDRVYSPDPLPIGAGQKSDDPATLARMIDLLEPRRSWRLLEVGTGSGYSTAVLSQLVAEVATVEYYESLAQRAKERIRSDGFGSVRFFCGDATDFDEPIGEFDALVIFAACIRTPYSVLNMLKPGGVVVFPLGPAFQQQIARYTNALEAPDISKNFKFFDLCNFDSIRGAYGWLDAPEAPSSEDPAEKPMTDSDAPEQPK